MRILIVRSACDIFLCVQINGVNINRASVVKYVGLYIDFNLKWNEQIQKIVKKVRYFSFVAYKLKYLPIKVLEIIYYAYVYSLLNYGLIAWGWAYSTHLEPLNNLQLKFIKILKSDKIPTIKQLYITRCVMFHYDSLQSSYCNSDSITRNKQLSLPSCKKTLTKKKSIYTATKYFNFLQNRLKDLAENKKTKKETIQSFIMQKFK